MKKIFIWTLIFTLAFTSCNDEDKPEKENNKQSGNNADVIGTWTGNYGSDNKGEIKLSIDNGSWILVFKDADATMTTYNGTWTRTANTLKLERKDTYAVASASLSENKLILEQSWSTSNGRPRTCELRKSGASGAGNTTLKIKNQSFTEITDVIWNNVTFSNNQYENSIKSGTDVTNIVEAGAGYIFFKRKSNPITARTRDIIVVPKNESFEFTFIDNTLIVEINNPNNNGTLGSVQSTVIWWDDAEGEMQPYYLKQSDVGYYSGSGSGYTSSGFLGSGSYYYFAPKNGAKSIRVGGTNTALLHLKINLTKKAKFSFWYANKYDKDNSSGTTFSINGIQKAKWTTDIDWSFLTFDLEPGENNLIWEKKDGYNTYRYYLSLDDILIYYTE
jgi:hypothetical protein